jgi:hypothetical protein
MSKRIPDAINRSDLSLGSYSGGKAVFYKHVPLWNSYSESIDKLDIYLAEYEEGTPYELVCKDEYGDYFYYGGWNTLQEAMAWLRNPTPLRRSR